MNEHYHKSSLGVNFKNPLSSATIIMGVDPIYPASESKRGFLMVLVKNRFNWAKMLCLIAMFVVPALFLGGMIMLALWINDQTFATINTWISTWVAMLLARLFWIVQVDAPWRIKEYKRFDKDD